MPEPKGKVTMIVVATAAAGVVALFALIAHELFSSPSKVAADVPHEDTPVLAPSAPTAPPPPVPTGSVVGAIAHALPAAQALPAPEPVASAASDASSAAPASSPAQQILEAIENPRAKNPSNVVQNPRNHSETYAFEVLAPYRSAEITRDKKDPNAFEFVGMVGPSLEKLAPSGGMREAMIQKDDQGQPFATWYAIDSGPLAGSFATTQGDRVRIISKAYLEANRSDFPASITAILDR